MLCDQNRLARTRSAARLMEKSKLAADEHSQQVQGTKYNPKESKGIYVDSHRVGARLDLDQSFEVGNRRLGGGSCSCSLLDGQLRMEVLDCNL